MPWQEIYRNAQGGALSPEIKQMLRPNLLTDKGQMPGDMVRQALVLLIGQIIY